MRIIAGQFKGTRLFSAKGQWLRPTTDMTREFIFSFIHSLVRDANVLDLFSGTGSLGLEALSRGAKKVVFVDRSPIAVSLVYKNMDKFGIQATVVKDDVRTFLKRQNQEESQYDIVFCDPPYLNADFDVIMSLVKKRNILSCDGMLIYESSSRVCFPKIAGYSLVKQKKMGETQISFYRLSHEP